VQIKHHLTINSNVLQGSQQFMPSLKGSPGLPSALPVTVAAVAAGTQCPKKTN